ncbi:MAG: hypothetical protein ACFCU1_06025 [Sumerlaeia bacterium]
MTPKNDGNTEDAKAPDRACENCGRWVDHRETLYQVKLEIYAEKTTDLTQSLEETEENQQTLEQLIHQLTNMSEEQVQEETDQVYENFHFNLCPQCRSELHKRIHQRKNLLV